MTPWTVARQAPLSMGFSRQDYWRGLPCPPPGIFPTQGLNLRLLRLLHWQVNFFFFFFFFLPPEPPGKPGQVRITKAKAGKEQAPQPCGDSLLVQWLGLQDESVGLIPGQRTKILQATWHRQNKKTKKKLKQKNPKQTWVLNFSAHPGCRITV